MIRRRAQGAGIHDKGCALRIAGYWLLFLSLGLAARGWALDRITTHDGRVMDGTIVRREAQSTPGQGVMVIIQTGPAQIALPAEQIASITPVTPEDDMLVQARETLKRGETALGLMQVDQALGMAMEPDTLANPLADLFLKHADQLATALPNLEDEQTTALRRLIVYAARARDLPTPRMADLIARRLEFGILLGNTSDTQRVLDWLGPGYFDKNPAERDRLMRWVLAALPTLQTPEAHARALKSLDLLRRIDPDLAGSQRTQLVLEWASQARTAGNYEEALELYAGQVLPDTPEIARDRIQVTLETAERAARGTGDLDSAAELYSRYGLPYVPDFARERLVVIWNDVGWRALRGGEFEAARAAFDRAEQIQPGSAKNSYAQLEFQQRRRATATSDTLARYQLGEYALERGLFSEAAAEFELAATNPQLRRNAEAQISNIRNKQAEEELKGLLKEYEAGHHTQVLAGIYTFMQKPYSIGYLKQAKQLEDLTREAMKLQAEARPQQAEGLFQRAQRAYFEGNYREAGELLDTILERYRDTVVYARARAFHATVRQRLDLAQLEQKGAPLSTTEAAAAARAQQATNPTPAPGLQLENRGETVISTESQVLGPDGSMQTSPATTQAATSASQPVFVPQDEEIPSTMTRARSEVNWLRRNLERMNRRP